MRRSPLILVATWALAVAAATGPARAENVAAIEAPSRLQQLGFEPVEIRVHFTAEADRESFRAFLNGDEVTDRFEPFRDGLRAFVTSSDGLNILAPENGGPIQNNGRNLLKTRVQTRTGSRDVDTVVFFVRTDRVETTRDAQGVWFVSGPNDVSLYTVFEAMGYAVASDRLWQLELFRRQARGRLAEIFGPSQLPTDMFVRTTGFSETELEDAFYGLDFEMQAVFRGYAAGINRRIAELRQNLTRLPLEFIALGFAPEDWTALDLLAWLVRLAREFDPGDRGQLQLKNAALYQELAANFPQNFEGMFDDLRWTNDPEAPTYLAPGASPAGSTQAMADPRHPRADLRPVAARMEALRQNVQMNLERINARVTLGSHGWAVAGSKTRSGNPILYAGPQMGFPTPSIGLEGSIRAGGLRVSGLSVAGIPAIIIGRTPHHAWALQVGHAHTVDFYIEPPSAPELHRVETIAVAGGNPVTLPIYRTVHGPVVNPMPFDPQTYVPDPANPILAWKYSQWGYEHHTVGALLDFARAPDLDAFDAAVERLGASEHIEYADREGNIAYWMSGRDPVRPPGEYRMPQGLLAPALEWTAEVLLPRSEDRNTPRGFYGGWNSKTAVDYDNLSSSNHGKFHRSHLIPEWLSTHDDLTYEEVRNFSLNIATTHSVSGGGNPWAFVAQEFSRAVDAHPTDARLAALALLDGFDGHFVPGGPANWASGETLADGWVLVDAWVREAIRLTFEDELGSARLAAENPTVLFNVILHAFGGSASGIVNHYDWFTNLADPSAPQTADGMIVKALDNVLAVLGPPPWNQPRGEIVFRHPLLGRVWATPFARRATYAQCIELGPSGPVRIESMFPLGESGTILAGPSGAPDFDPNFFSMTEFYDPFVHRPFPLFD